MASVSRAREKELDAHINELTERVIHEAIDADVSEAAEGDGPACVAVSRPARDRLALHLRDDEVCRHEVELLGHLEGDRRYLGVMKSEGCMHASSGETSLALLGGISVRNLH